jgi:hypothetical protein
MKRIVTRNCFCLFIIFLTALIAGSCIFSPKKDSGQNTGGGQILTPSTPDNVVNNLKVAFQQLNINFYRDTLHDNYFYTSKSTTDTLDIRFSKSEDVRVIENVMNNCTSFVFTSSEYGSMEEWGKDVPNPPNGAIVVDEHPSEVWLVKTYLIDMDIFTKTYGDFKIHQLMEFKFVQNPQSKLYSIIQWNDLTIP